MKSHFSGAEELLEFMQGCGFKVVEEDIQDMMMEIDEDGAGDVDLHEFLTVMSRRTNPDIEAELIDIFKVYITLATHFPVSY